MQNTESLLSKKEYLKLNESLDKFFDIIGPLDSFVKAINFLNEELSAEDIIEQGFINMGVDNYEGDKIKNFKFIIKNKEIFRKILDKSGWYAEEDHWDYEETVFAKK